ncbi:MAG: hypothetical protein K0R38_1935 [Polyangiaceae bacterium]|jgi:hypothetical protein|nr:hypothetical protein [Polyangiaceae bacterium]
MRAHTTFAWLLAALAVPLACSSEDKPPGLGEGAASGTSSRSGSFSADPGGQSSVEPGVGGQPSGGASDGPAVGEVGGEGIYVGDGGAPANPASVCSRDAEWTTTPLEGVDTAADERLLAMTPDELTLVFSRDDALFVRDEAQATPVTVPLGYTHALGVALTADGLSLIVVAEDGSRFAEVSRKARGTAFSASASTARFTVLNNGQITSGDAFSSPALSADGQSFYYTARKGPSVAYVYRAYGAKLSETERQDPVTLGTEDGQAKLVVSVSSDERTLFVLDEALGYVTGLWSETPAAEFSGAVPFEGFETVFTSEDCARMYGTTEVDGSLGIVSGTPK